MPVTAECSVHGAAVTAGFFLEITFSFFFSLRFLLTALCFSYQHIICWHEIQPHCLEQTALNVWTNSAECVLRLSLFCWTISQWNSYLLWFTSSYCKRFLLLSSSSLPKWPSEVWANIFFHSPAARCNSWLLLSKNSLWNATIGIYTVICMGSVLSLMTGHVRRRAVMATARESVLGLRPELSVRTSLVTVMYRYSHHFLTLLQGRLKYFFFQQVSVCHQTPLGMLLTISAD